MTSALIVKEIILVGVSVVRLKLFRLKAEGGGIHALPPAMQGKEKHDCSTLVECNSCIKHGFEMRFFLTVFNSVPGRSWRRSLVRPVHLSILSRT